MLELARIVAIVGAPYTVISTPLAGADFPDVAIDERMFNTDCSVSALQPYHAFEKQLFAGVALQLSNIPAGNVERSEQSAHVTLNDVLFLTSNNGKAVSLLHPRHAA